MPVASCVLLWWGTARCRALSATQMMPMHLFFVVLCGTLVGMMESESVCAVQLPLFPSCVVTFLMVLLGAVGGECQMHKGVETCALNAPTLVAIPT